MHHNRVPRLLHVVRRFVGERHCGVVHVVAARGRGIRAERRRIAIYEVRVPRGEAKLFAVSEVLAYPSEWQRLPSQY